MFLSTGPTLEKFKLKVTIHPDSVRKIFARNLSCCIGQCLHSYVKSLMDQVRIAIEESVLETIQYAKDHGKLVLSVNSIPFYAFTEGHEMIVDLEKLCKLHFNHVVTSKIFVAAIKIKPNFEIAEKTVMALIQSKKWKKSKELFHRQFGKEIEQNKEPASPTNKSCVIS